MVAFRPEKVLGALPSVLTPNGFYAVRTGDGIMLFVADSTGSIAYPIRQPQQFLGIIFESVNTGSANQIVPVYPLDFNLTAIAVQNTRIGSSGSGTISVSFGSGANFVAVPGLSSRSVSTTNTVYNVTGSGQNITTSQQLQIQFNTVTNGPIDVSIYFYL